jgi:hypothetical protein
LISLKSGPAFLATIWAAATGSQNVLFIMTSALVVDMTPAAQWPVPDGRVSMAVIVFELRRGMYGRV